MKEIIDIYSFPVYYISFDRKLDLESDIKKRGWSDFHHFQAVKGNAKTALEWFQEDILSLKSYVDLSRGEFHTYDSIISLGAIGCYMSHLGIWKLAVQREHAFVVVMEDDINLNCNLSYSDVREIVKILEKPRSLYVSGYKFNPVLGHFYIASLEACKIMIERALPMETQVDVYIDSLSTAGLISKSAFLSYNQKLHFSSIRTICLKCLIPADNLKILLFVIVLCAVIFHLIQKSKK